MDGDDDGGAPGADRNGEPLPPRWPDRVPENGDWLLWPPTIEPISTEPPDDEYGLGFYY